MRTSTSELITGTSTMPPLGMPKKIKILFKHDYFLGWVYKITVNTWALQVNAPCFYRSYAAMHEMIVSSAKLFCRFDAV